MKISFKHTVFLFNAAALVFLMASCGGGSDPRPGTGGGGGNDPLLPHQWYINNTGQSAFASGAGVAGADINLGSVNKTGAGVIVAVIDTGIEIAHEDLAANVTSQSGAISYDFVNDDNNPTNTVSIEGDHGTSVSGIIAAKMNNGIGLRGIAGNASLIGFNMLHPDIIDQNFAKMSALGGDLTLTGGAHIFNQSYGISVNFDVAVDPDFELLLDVNTGTGADGLLRGGKGGLFVKSAGNGFYSSRVSTTACDIAISTGVTCQNANADPSHTHPGEIVVAALNASGVKSSYSTAGSPIWISAPGGEFGYDSALWSGYTVAGTTAESPAMVTTDQSGCTTGYSRWAYLYPIAPKNTFEDGYTGLNDTCNYTSTFNGTSSAAPATSGVIALILEANPQLTWRDVKHILAKTARKVHPGITPVLKTLTGGDYVAEPGWLTNAAGYNFHNWYGFGGIDASGAVAMAAGYTPNPWPALADTGFLPGSVTSSAIPDNSITGAAGTIAVTTANNTGIGFIEALRIRVNITHTYTGDVGIEVTSPSGTKSVLWNIDTVFNTADLTDMVLASNAFYGENPDGTWTIKVVDGFSADTGTLDSWEIRINGH